MDHARVGEIPGCAPAPIRPSVLERIGINGLVLRQTRRDGNPAGKDRDQESGLHTAVEHNLDTSEHSDILEADLAPTPPASRAASSSRFQPSLAGTFRRNVKVCAGDADELRATQSNKITPPFAVGRGRRKPIQPTCGETSGVPRCPGLPAQTYLAQG